MNERQIAAFWSKVQRGAPDQCWEWTGRRSERGYGRFGSGRGMTSVATRVLWFLIHGEWPADGIEVCHSCDNPPCMNPEHLFLGTHSVNMRDMNAKRRRNQKGERHPRALLTVEQVRKLRAAKRDGRLHVRRAATALGVSEATIDHAVSGRNWSHVA